MSVFDLFKKTKKAPAKKETKRAPEKEAARLDSPNGAKRADLAPKEKKAQVKEPEAKITAKEETPAGKIVKPLKRVEKKQFSHAYKILTAPHVTEKAGLLAEQGSYIFRTSPFSNKHEIKQAVQDLYGVSVEKVRIVNIPRKARRVGRNEGFRPGFKKAMVKLAKGEKIEIMPR